VVQFVMQEPGAALNALRRNLSIGAEKCPPDRRPKLGLTHMRNGSIGKDFLEH
jgi:hypothetical protein